MLSAILLVIGYLLGSICSAVIVSYLFGLPDPRTEGSQNPGATNILRLAGKKYALIVLLIDILKGLLPVLLAQVLNLSPMVAGFTCLAAVMGHMYPVFFHFQGGKGVATAIGGLLGLNFLLGVCVITIWLLVANFTRYSSLASIVAILLSPLLGILMLGTLQVFMPLFIMAIFILYRHKDNISRLVVGEEPKLKFKRNAFFRNSR